VIASATIRTRRRQGGLSLIELMITLLVSLLVIGGLLQVYLSSKQSYNAQEQLARMQESGRFAMDLVTADLRRSGYWGGSVDLRRIEGGLPGAVNPASHACADNAWGRMVRWRVSGLNNTNAGYGCATDYDPAAASDILTVRYAGFAPVAALSAGGLYLRANTESGVIMTGALGGDPANTLLPIAGDDVTALVYPLVSHAYYVGESGRTCPGGAAIPSLWRVRLDPATGLPLAEQIAPGVERLEAQYLLNGMYVDANAVDAAAADGNGWLNVRAVRVWMLVRGECPEQGIADGSTYNLGDTVYTPADNFRRQLYSSTVMLRNRMIGDVGN
jgi:type IV pilus assembly protein PilW